MKKYRTDVRVGNEDHILIRDGDKYPAVIVTDGLSYGEYAKLYLPDENGKYDSGKHHSDRGKTSDLLRRFGNYVIEYVSTRTMAKITGLDFRQGIHNGRTV